MRLGACFRVVPTWVRSVPWPGPPVVVWEAVGHVVLVGVTPCGLLVPERAGVVAVPVSCWLVAVYLVVRGGFSPLWAAVRQVFRVGRPWMRCFLLAWRCGLPCGGVAFRGRRASVRGGRGLFAWCWMWDS